MCTELALVLVLLAVAIVMFAINRPRMNVVALIMLTALPFTGVITMKEALAGFSDSNIVLIAALFVIGEGLVRTGVAQRLGDWLIATAPNLVVNGELDRHGVEGFREAFQRAQAEVKDAHGATAQVKFEASHAYPPFNLANDTPVVQHAIRAAEALGMKPNTVFSNGGLDANWSVKHGLPTVSIGAGQNEVHTVKECVDLPEFANGCRLAVAMATLEG
jgi:tripeptide aminopeptidase